MGVFSINFSISWVGSRELRVPGDAFWASADTPRGNFQLLWVLFLESSETREITFNFPEIHTTGKSWPC